MYVFKTVVWLYPGMGGWHFASVPKDISGQIVKDFGFLKRGWGSIPVIATVGNTSWKTSIFPDKKSGGHLLPLKAEVRKKEEIVSDKEIVLTLEVLVES